MIEIREVTNKDFESVETLYKTSIKANKKGFIQNLDEIRDIKKMIVDIKKDGGAFYACFINQKAVAMIGINKENQEEIEITRFHIYKEYQGKKLGQTLLSTLFLWASENNIKKVNLEVSKTQDRAIALYLKNGFEIYKEEVLKYNIAGNIEEYDTFFMHKVLQ